jgi:hypothetical protein
MGGFLALLLSLDSRKRSITRENIMVLNGTMEQDELTLMPVNNFESINGSDSISLPVFMFGDDDEIDEDDDFDDEDDDFDDDDDDDFDDELDDDDDDDEDDDYDEDDYEDEDEDDVDYDDFDE